MLTPEEWQSLIGTMPGALVTEAHSFRGMIFDTWTRPALLGCRDGHDYVVKFATQDGLLRSLCSDQIMGHIAETIRAPAPVVRLVDVPQVLIDNEPDLATLPAGIAHGSRYLKNISKVKQGIRFQNLPENRSRFALLAIMYGLAGVDGDFQFFYEDSTNTVWSCDHGHFFHYGPQWSIESLKASPAVAIDPTIAGACNFQEEEIVEAAKCLIRLINESIARAVASPVDAWQIIMAERVALAEHFRTRADSLAA